MSPSDQWATEPGTLSLCMLGSTIHSCHTLLTHSYIMSYIVIHCHAMTYIVRKSLLRGDGIWFNTMLFWTLQCCAPPSIKYSVWLMCACTVSWYVCHTLYRWIWYLYGRIGRVDGCGINTAHYPVFGRWKPWVGLIYRSDGQKGYNPTAYPHPIARILDRLLTPTTTDLPTDSDKPP